MPLGIDESLTAVLDCVAVALEESGAPVCQAGNTVGNPAIASCCDCGDGEGELWGNLLRIYRANGATYAETQGRKPCSPAQWAAEFQVTVARCFPTLDDSGELPSAEERSEAARKLHADVATVERAIRCCDLGDPAHVVRITVDTDPSGGCSYLIAVVQIPVSLRGKDNAR